MNYDDSSEPKGLDILDGLLYPVFKDIDFVETETLLPARSLWEKDLLGAIGRHQVLIIEGEAVRYLSLWISRYLSVKIGCTQPCHYTAKSVAARVAQIMCVKLGNEVGYVIPFEDCTSERTVIKYMTDCTLVSELSTEPDLASYGAIIIDEAHERTLHTDILFEHLKDITRFRPDLKIVISTASNFDAKHFAKYFNDAPIFRIPGSSFPVHIYNLKAPVQDYLHACVETILEIHEKEGPGDMICILTDQHEIETCKELLQDRVKRLGSKLKDLIILTLYASLPKDMQAKFFELTPHNASKVVLATNITETDLTIDLFTIDIKYVVDPGLSKQNNINPITGMESLMIVPISKALANNRARWAGRTEPGKCLRLYTEWSYKHELDDNTIPEIQRSNLRSAVLSLKALGINNFKDFDFIDRPPLETLALALEQLYALGALNHHGELTTLGRKMAKFPVDPMMAKMILASERYKCSEEVVTIAAMLSVNGAIFYRPKDADTARISFNHMHGDHLSLLQVYNQWAETAFSKKWCNRNFIQYDSMIRARDIRKKLVNLMHSFEIEMISCLPETTNITKAIISGYFYQVARLSKDGLYKTIKHNETVMIHPTSALFEERPPLVLYKELEYTTELYMRQLSLIESEILLEVAPHYYKKTDSGDISIKT